MQQGSVNNKFLLVLGGSRQALEGLRQIKALGFRLAVCDYDEQAPGFEIADQRIHGSVYHLDDCLPAIEAFHAEHPIDGVMCLACDVPHVVARIADKLSLPSISIEAADRAVDKLAMKQKFEADGVLVPPYACVADVDELRELQAKWCDIVVKPVDSRGSKGVSLISDPAQIAWAFGYALESSPSGRVMAEKYLSGPQISSESIIIDGHAVTPALSLRSYEFLERFAPFIVENGGDMPAKLDADIEAATKDTISRAAASLGVENGIVKGDVVLHDGKPYIIELAARLSGGYFCTHQIPFSVGVKLVEAAAKLAVGEILDANDWHAKNIRPVSTRWLIPGSGTITHMGKAEDVLNCDGVLAFEHWCKLGDEIGEAQNAAASVAMVQATGDSQKAATKNAEAALLAFKVETK